MGHPSPTCTGGSPDSSANATGRHVPMFGTAVHREPKDFCEWLEQFELVAGACQRSEQAKLVNLAMRLLGQAYSFYRSCRVHPVRG